MLVFLFSSLCYRVLISKLWLVDYDPICLIVFFHNWVQDCLVKNCYVAWIKAQIWLWLSGWLYLFTCPNFNVFIDVPLPILWYANNLHDDLLISGMLWSTIDAPQWDESHGKIRKLNPGCKVNAVATSVCSHFYKQKIFDFDWNERESKRLERSELEMENSAPSIQRDICISKSLSFFAYNLFQFFFFTPKIKQMYSQYCYSAATINRLCPSCELSHSQTCWKTNKVCMLFNIIAYGSSYSSCLCNYAVSSFVYLPRKILQFIHQ